MFNKSSVMLLTLILDAYLNGVCGGVGMSGKLRAMLLRERHLLQVTQGGIVIAETPV